MAYEDSYDTIVRDSFTGVEVNVYVYVKVPDGYSLIDGALEQAADRAALYMLEDGVNEE